MGQTQNCYKKKMCVNGLFEIENVRKKKNRKFGNNCVRILNVYQTGSMVEISLRFIAMLLFDGNLSVVGYEKDCNFCFFFFFFLFRTANPVFFTFELFVTYLQRHCLSI